MSKYHNDNTAASDPGRLAFSIKRLRRLEPHARGLRGWWWRRRGFGRQWEESFVEHLRLGDSRAAIVLSTDPLLVAPYTDELDCVVLLDFPTYLVAEHALKPGSRLLTVNTYTPGGELAPDLVPGPANLHRYSNFHPIIAEFFSDDVARINARKAQITAAEWQRTAQLGQDALRQAPHRRRNGSPLFSHAPSA